MGGGGKAESTPWRGPAGAQRPPLGGVYSALGTRGQSPWRSHPPENGAVRLPRPHRGTKTAPLHGATLAGDVAASRAKTRPLRHRRSAASRSEGAAGARTARRKARVPAGQPKDSAPLRSAAGKSATLENPAHFRNAPDRHPKGQDYRLGARQRIERVAVRQRHDAAALCFNTSSSIERSRANCKLIKTP